MSRPQKIMKPIKASFIQVINAVADGKGMKHVPLKNQRADNPPPKPKEPRK